MVCKTPGCRHNRYMHTRKPQEKYGTITGKCRAMGKDGPCPCTEFTEPE